ncbi:hypothetical protein OPT61_g6331 [Boeremia exigua]|uniref:Uncharacterized protein n=1 Tax=Boeremia exigua TaxID=749465 RepID=A0ACC2I735_9PLEO|nr:hypothetical protein OPT61_g6331 [Boeremia exigua]
MDCWYTMAFEKVMIIGNWELCLSIINALLPSDERREHLNLQLSILTNNSQWLHLPPHVGTTAVKHQKTDFSITSLQSAFAGQDLVISTTAGGDSDQQIDIDLKSAGRAKVIEHLRSISSGSSPFEWVGVATGYTLDSGLISGNMGFDMEWHSAIIHGIGTETFAASSLQRIGQVVTRVITHWKTVKNQYIYAAGVLTCANEILRSVEKAVHREFTVGNYDVEDCIREGESRIERGFPDSSMFLLERSILYDEELGAAEPFKSRSSNKLLQLAPESVETIVINAYHDLKHHGKPGCGCSS